ncbi:MAG TPA: transglycosylase family protein [Candidatus Polarisedimenticolaceae bacterium]|nr:transglycosylase family protein [Candidatus Polarisedimenticolaceae bacterium]
MLPSRIAASLAVTATLLLSFAASAAAGTSSFAADPSASSAQLPHSALSHIIVGAAQVQAPPMTIEAYVALRGARWVKLWNAHKALLGRIAQCESGGNPKKLSESPPGLYRGKYQFSKDTWKTVGSKGDPAAAPEWMQDWRALRLLLKAGIGPWPNCGPQALRAKTTRTNISYNGSGAEMPWGRVPIFKLR